MNLRQLNQDRVQRVKAVAFALCLIPLVHLGWLGLRGRLGANPIEYITHSTGWWTLAFLLLTLTITPARRLTNWNWLLKLRRMLGLYAFFYVCLHFTTYLWLDQFFDWKSIVKDIGKRPFITVGFAAFLLLIPLASTSTHAMVRRLGARRWQRLHRAVYAIGVLGVLHFWWLVKKDIREPLIFGALLGALLLVRLVYAARKAAASTPPSGTRSQTA
ncbi:MAG TPA: protein-methionine-sulfoxide reductase heme-binding subunit MsrQ [Burkholderiales bacterium]|nr:protein-methionine-sulfoxide reductase heme-binding subunit MsrQ [Burkholderiales bacterium]